MRLFLFDVDGVLVDPVAYRLGSTRSVELLCAQIGLQNSAELALTAEEIAYFESCGVHDVWDIANIAVAAVIRELAFVSLNHEPSVDPVFVSGSVGLESFRAAQSLCSRPQYRQIVEHLKSKDVHSQHPPDVALAHFSAELREKVAGKPAEKWISLLASFLPGARSVYRSQVTRLFQNIILGSHEFEQTYGLPSVYSGASLLKAEDVVLISSPSVDKLKQLKYLESSECGSGSVDRADRVAIYTARPSHPPSDVRSREGYPGEAEIAREQSGLGQFPLIGMGMMEWLAERHDERAEDLTKPNTTQAVAALLAAIEQRNDSLILEEAFRGDKAGHSSDGTLFGALKERETTVFVFEDTVSGVLPMLNVTERLRASGCKLSTVALGIARDESKRAALEKHCRRVFDDVNEALDFALDFAPA